MTVVGRGSRLAGSTVPAPLTLALAHLSRPHCFHVDLNMFCCQGERGQAFYIVESGQLSTYKDGGPHPVMSYGPGTLVHPHMCT